MAEISCLSYNIRFVLDRHEERMPLVKEIIQGKQGQHDVACLQEVLNGGKVQGQDVQLKKELPGKWKTNAGPCFPSYLERLPLIGPLFAFLFSCTLGLAFRDAYAYFNSTFLETILTFLNGPMLFHTPLVGDIVYLLLGSGWSFGNLILARKEHNPMNLRPLLLGGKYRIAQRTLLHVKSDDYETTGKVHRMWIVNVHLSDTPGFPSEELRAKCERARTKEFEKIIRWADSDPRVQKDDTILIMGDFNSPPHEELHTLAQKRGFSSAFKEIHGEEPAFTFHQSHECPTKDLGDEECYDYIFYRGPVQVQHASLVGNKPHQIDKTLYPSDHFGISAKFRFL